MTQQISLRLGEDAARELGELLKLKRATNRNAAIVEAIHLAYTQARSEALEAAYEAAITENPHHPYSSTEERDTLRRRRNAREARA